MGRTLFLILPAAGSGSRMGGPVNKIFMEVGGKPTLCRTLDAFVKFSDKLTSENITLKTVIVTSRDNIEPMKALVSDGGYSIVNNIVEGGATRTDSVYNGIKAIAGMNPEPDDYVFIHDGARCLVDQTVLANCLNGLTDNPVCVAAVPVKSTIKIVDNSNTVVNTPKRSTLMEVQTPQAFLYDELLRSYDNAFENNIEATDDTSLAEALGIKVVTVLGSYSNIKITTPEDIAIAEGILKDRNEL